jgi:hypothetical protein
MSCIQGMLCEQRSRARLAAESQCAPSTDAPQLAARRRTLPPPPPPPPLLLLAPLPAPAPEPPAAVLPPPSDEGPFFFFGTSLESPSVGQLGSPPGSGAAAATGAAAGEVGCRAARVQAGRKQRRGGDVRGQQWCAAREGVNLNQRVARRETWWRQRW